MLLFVCTWCFGRLLLAVIRARHETLKSQVQRNRALQDEKLVHAVYAPQAGQSAIDGNPPMLPPVKTNRWFISKTFLLAKASSAATTVSASLHRRSASGPQGPRPSTTSDHYCRPSVSTHSDHHSQGHDVQYGFLAHDPATTTRYGQYNRGLGSQPENLVPPPTPRSITFSQGIHERAMSPAPTLLDRLGAFSRSTDRTGTRVSVEESRPSIGSYLSIDSSGTETGGVSKFLSAGRLQTSRNNGLSRREARKACARLGGHLIGCVASWTCVMPFLVYKIQRPSDVAPLYANVILAGGISL